MTKLIAAAALGLAFTAGAALAADPPAAPATPEATRPANPGLSVETTPISDLLANPGAKAVLDEKMPGLSTAPQLEMVKGMSLKALEQFPQAQLTDEKLADIQAAFDKLTK